MKIFSMAGEIKCFFFSEFDPVAGPKITYQVSNVVLKLYHKLIYSSLKFIIII